MNEPKLGEAIDKAETSDDSIRIAGIIEPLETGDIQQEYNDSKLNAKREKFKMEVQGPTLKIGWKGKKSCLNTRQVVLGALTHLQGIAGHSNWQQGLGQGGSREYFAFQETEFVDLRTPNPWNEDF